MAEEFVFPKEIEKQHAVIMAFLSLADGVAALKECYFRRYPFRGLPDGGLKIDNGMEDAVLEPAPGRP